MYLPDFNEELARVTVQSVIALVVSYYGVQAYMTIKAKAMSEREKSWILTAISRLDMSFLVQWFRTD